MGGFAACVAHVKGLGTSFAEWSRVHLRIDGDFAGHRCCREENQYCPKRFPYQPTPSDSITF